MNPQTMLWISFFVIVTVMLVLDLRFAQKKESVLTIKKAALWSFFWIALAFVFNALILYWEGHQLALEFFTAYLVEESLSVDNLFVFHLIFNYFSVPRSYQHKVLFWGIVGVVVMRGIFIFAGVALIDKFHWMIYIFGAFLIVTGIKMAFQRDKEIKPENNPILRLFRRFTPITPTYEGDRFFVKKAGRLWATPLFMVVLVVETTDLIFAVDSIPAVLGISVDRMVVFTSNIFAVLGLRALFFALSGFLELFHYLNYGLSAILVFVGAKMLTEGIYEMPTPLALGVVVGILTLSIAASIIWPKKKGEISL
ncbi:MAG: tellurium resistance protein TerC [Deltaproteobacteria bacterium RIFCSPLOWO2_02_FULL_50_16]|nr:MAG: tellurium resistance protein TerC [Deltaproteobacteria bacterium RIFCSPHIGHO2_02_FULL_50_15]OGQ57021.1 MAG: tellurium resistance protein TerC [Deltaproteobacteria bacterium RIFCSPLOWO2_02_FULL_50_16]